MVIDQTLAGAVINEFPDPLIIMRVGLLIILNKRILFKKFMTYLAS